MFGKTHTKEYKELISKKFSGEGNPNWQGGISDNPYENIFNNELKTIIREREEFKCFLCGNDNKNKELCVHHIDYDKANNSFYNLVAVCSVCHGRTNSKRKYWTPLLKNMLLSQYGNQQPSSSKGCFNVDEKVQRLIGEEILTNNPNKSAQHLK